MLLEAIQKIAAEKEEQVVQMRRHIHANPELSFQEYNTRDYIRGCLESFGIEDISPCTETGLVALIRGRDPERKTVALRADIDALPIVEANTASYRSRNDGVMHACGHDVHSSSLLGTAAILNEIRDQFEGTVKLIFQPGEERLPGGASLMIEEGVLDNPKVESIIGQHVMPLLEAGQVGFRKGLYMASADEIYIRVKGKGGHGAHPHMTIDPVALSAQLISALQLVVSRNSKPAMPSVLSIGKIIGNGSTNVIPDEVYMEGTFRTFDETWRMRAHELIRKTCVELIGSLGGICEVEVRKGYPHLRNHELLTERMKEAAIAYVGPENVKELEIWPAGEDFAFFAQAIPACFYRLGTRNESRGITGMLHTPTFDIDEKALGVGPGLMAWLATEQLKWESDQ
ncbi:MAG: amidohydrolase [Flavobacteriales bacterium]|nr:amidohydrolase [Flavobacteriales bacterium]